MMEEGKPFFDVWQYEVSDEIQSFATAFGERHMLECAINNWQKQTHPGLKDLLEKTIFLHTLEVVRENIAWYISNGVVSLEAAAELDEAFNQAVKDFLPYMNTAAEGLGLPKLDHLYSPIARDYVAFNAQDDCENFDSAGKLFDFTTTGAPRAKL